MAGFNAAVPPLGLLLQEPAGRLALDRPTWHHLVAWLEEVERLPADLSPLSPQTRSALDALRTALQAVGSPRVVQTSEPASGPRPPLGLYAGVVWTVRRLQAGAAVIAGRLQRLRDAGSGLSAAAWKDALLQLGALAQDSRSGVGSVAQAVRATAPDIARAQTQLARAFVADTERLREAQETLGALQARIGHAEAAVRRHGLLPILTRSSQAQQELHELQEQSARHAAETEPLRQAVSAVAGVTDQAGWVEPALAAIAEFLEQVQRAWTQVGSGVAQAAADATNAQLEDPTWREAALGLAEAAARWQAVAQAAQEFLAAVPAGWAARVLHEETS